MREPLNTPLRLQAADALRRARRLPVGPGRNDLRQLAIGLLWLEKQGMAETVAALASHPTSGTES